MKKIISHYALLILFLILFPIYSVLAGDKIDENIKHELENRLKIFKKDYGLHGSDLFLILRDSLKNRAWSKGGLGIINKNISIVLASKSNELIIKDKHWIGSNRETTEIIIIDRNNNVFSILSKQDKTDLSKGFIFVYFKPDIIKFIDSTNEYFIEYSRFPSESTRKADEPS